MTLTRREFVTTVAGAGAAFMIVPRNVLGRGRTAPSDLANVAIVGIGGMGASNAQAVMSQNIVAICDVDDRLVDAKLAEWKRRAQSPPPPQGGRGQRGQGPNAAASQWKSFGKSKAQEAADAKWAAQDDSANVRRFVDEQVPRVKRYRDYREMLDKQKDIDAVIVATPDHMHAVISSNAMDLGKHVYTQKPLCWSVHEARHLAKKAAEKKVVTQMGNQRHSADENRRAVEYIMGGAIGDVREVHVWTNRPFGFWPQGIPRPARLEADPANVRWDNHGVTVRIADALEGKSGYKVPDELSWDLFLGVAGEVEYHPLYHPFNWRGWVDWGQGALGDMGAHLIDFPMWALKLGLPDTIETEATPFNGVCYPNATTTTYHFPKRNGMPEVKLTWYDGGLMPPDPEELGEEKLSPGGGILYIGKKGKLLQDGAIARLLPASRHNSYGAPKERLTRVPHEEHEMNWINTIKGRDQISCAFDYASQLTETMLLGIVSLRANSAKLRYDAANMRVTNTDAATQFLTREYRQGYSL